MPIRITLISLALAFTLADVAICANIDETFRKPPESARPWTYWFWINGNITREGITADLEAMKRVGIGGVLIMEVANPRNMAPAGPVEFASTEWKELFEHVLREADRLGLQVNMNNDAGWTGSGGPWVKPENSMKQLVATTATVSGPARVDLVLPQPESVEGLYQDIAVFAVPQDASTTATDIGNAAVTGAIELSDAMTSAGRVTWNVPSGSWLLTRIGYTSTGRKNKPAPESGTGLEVDKFDADAIAAHFDALIGSLADEHKNLTGKTFTHTHIDSWEVGSQNWTDSMAEEFRKRRGYDLMPWLPVLVEITTAPAELTKRFHRDFAVTCAELIDEKYAAALRKLSNKQGLKLSIEGYGPTGFMNPLTYGAQADLPVSEFWIERWDAWHLLSSRLMASVAHVHGKPIVAAESFTSFEDKDPYTEYPFSVKTTGDWAMSEGVNRMIFHRTVHDPWTHLVPGMSFAGFGWHVDRNQTWFEQSRAFMKYLARCQWILQQGRFVADVCRLVPDGEDRGNGPGMRQIPMYFEPLSAGYNYDYISDKALLTEVSVDNGELVTQSGMKYKALQLPEYTTMTVELVQKIAELVSSGATVVGPKPSQTPGLTNYPDCDIELCSVADKAWDTAAERHVVSDKSINQVLIGLKVPPDFQYEIDPPVTREAIKSITGRTVKRRPRGPEPLLMPTKGLNWIHRSLSEGEFYFIANPQYRDVNAICTFRVSGVAPEIWYPETGEIRTPAIFSSGDSVQMPIHFGPAESVFVVFRKKIDPAKQIVEVEKGGSILFGVPHPGPTAGIPLVWVNNGVLETEAAPTGEFKFKLGDGQSAAVEFPESQDPIQIDGPWTVEFQPGRGAPEHSTFQRLMDWTKHEQNGIKYFSGTATYHTTFEHDNGTTDTSRWQLNLGDVKVIAEVRLNGKDLGILWKQPFELDITSALQPGRNDLEIKVTSLWPNRMIGDEQYPDDSTPDHSWTQGKLPAWPDWIKNKAARPDPRRITFTTFKHYQKDSKLIPSGLLGPVLLQPMQTQRVE